MLKTIELEDDGNWPVLECDILVTVEEAWYGVVEIRVVDVEEVETPLLVVRL